MKKTPEQKAAARKAREKEAAERARMYPSSFWSQPSNKGEIQLILDAGDRSSLSVRFKGKAFYPCPNGGGEWEVSNFWISDVEKLAHLIAALSARLRTLVEELNTDLKGIPVSLIELPGKENT